MSRYWVGGTGSWSNTAHWAASSGGAGGQSVPDTSHDVFFDANSNATDYTMTLDIFADANNVSLSGPASGTLTYTSAQILEFIGNFVVAASGVTLTNSGGTISGAGAGTQTITSNGVTLNNSLNRTGTSGAIMQLVDDLNLGPGLLLVNIGFFDDHSKNITAGGFTATDNSFAIGVTFGTGNTWTLNGNWTAPPGNFTTTNSSGTATIKITAGSSTFSGGGHSYPNLYFSATGTSTVSIGDGGNTFQSLKVEPTGHTLSLKRSVTNTIASAAGLQIDGDATHQTSLISSTSGLAATLSCASGTISLNYVSLKDQTATGGATFRAPANNGCVSTSNNTGWNFANYYLQSCLATTSPAALVTKATARKLSATTSPVALLARMVNKVFASLISCAAFIAKMTGKPLLASASTATSLKKSVGKIALGTTSPIASAIKSVGKILSAVGNVPIKNLSIQSQAFDNGAWQKSQSGAALAPVVTADFAVAPDGTTTADRAVFSLNGGTASGDISKLNTLSSITVVNGVQYTMSIWAKTNDASTIIIELIDDAIGGSSQITVTPIWQRFSVTVTTASTTGKLCLRLRGAETPTNSNSADLSLWGSQYELGSVATAYIPTTTVPATAGGTLLKKVSKIALATTTPAKLIVRQLAKIALATTTPIKLFAKAIARSLLAVGSHPVTNLQPQSQAFDNAAVWGPSGSGSALAPVVTADYAIAPDGTQTADRVVFSLNGHTTSADFSTLAGPGITVVNGAQYCESVYAKTNDGATVVIQFINGQIGGANAITVNGSWQRFSFVTTTNSTLGQIQMRLRGGASPTNSDTADLALWGAQFEAGSDATAYIPTGASAVTVGAASLLKQIAKRLLRPLARVNFALRSADMTNNAVWVTDGEVATPNATTAPDGTNTAAFIAPNTSNASHTNLQAIFVELGVRYTQSFYAKPGGWLQLIRMTGTGSNTLIVDFSTTPPTVLSGTGTITADQNGFYRISWSDICTAGGTQQTIRIRWRKSDGTETFIGDGVSGLYVWGAQLEAAAAVTAYIPTTTIFGEASTTVASLARLMTRAISASTAPLGSLVKQVAKASLALTSPLALLSRQARKAFLAATVPVARVTRSMLKSALATAATATIFTRPLVNKYLVVPVGVTGLFSFIRRIIAKPSMRALFGNPELSAGDPNEPPSLDGKVE